MPQKGDVVTFAFEAHARRELPVNPEITRNRSDMSWQDVLSNYASDKKNNGKFINIIYFILLSLLLFTYNQ